MVVPATVTVIIKLIVENKKSKITWFNAVTSWLMAVGVSYIFYPVITKHVDEAWQPVVIAVAVLTGEKVVTYVIYKAKIDDFLTWLFNTAWEKLKKYFA